MEQLQSYCAFISYRHQSPDQEIAKALHTGIETYGIPASIKKQTGRKKMGKVFRDQEELPLSSDLGADIEAALDRSEWFIAICSPRYLESKWCLRELEYFIEHKGREHVLVLLVEGEPKDSFPETLRFVPNADGTFTETEPLAADVRAATPAGNLKRLKNEKLRILAPMLGLGFDDLKRRARQRKLRIAAIVGAATLVAATALGVFLTFRAADPSKEEEMRYDFMVRMEMWNRIMMTADRHNPDTPKGVSCLNLALGMSGRMPDSQFSYTQIGPEGLLPGFVLDYTNPLSTAEIFWHLGMVNTAQRYTFEAQEAIPDFQKSARCYRRLAETNIVNGDDGVARKYLAALTHTLFYRRWARETLSSLDAGDIFDRRPELARVRALRFKERDFLFSDTEMDSMLGLLKVENPDNTMALDYLMAWCLLRKDLDRFVQCIGMVEAPVMPKAYQEALLLRWVQTHSDFTGMPTYLAPVHAQRISRFLADMQAGKPEAEMRRAYGDSYWYYFFYYDLP